MAVIIAGHDVYTIRFEQVYGGAALNAHVGDSLAAQGVSLYTVYGATEIGMISTVIRREHAYALCSMLASWLTGSYS